MKALIIPFVVLVIVGLIVLSLSIRVVTQYEKGVLFRLGKVVGVKDPGLAVIIPVIDRLMKVSLRIVTMPIQSQGIITRDNVSVDISAVAYFRVVDAVKSVIAIENVHAAINQIAQTTLRKVVGQHTLDQALSETDTINADIRKILDIATLEWGVEVTLVELKDIQLPDSMKRAMARQAEAEREKRAKIIAAEGESMAAAALGEASDTMMAHPLALQLRNLQTLVELGVEKNTTIVFPAPLMSAIGELGAFLAREGAAVASPPQPVTTTNGADTSTQPGSRRRTAWLPDSRSSPLKPPERLSFPAGPASRHTGTSRLGHPPRIDSNTNRRLIMPDTLVDVDILRAAVQLACRAPSLHNSQPWQWVAEGAGLHLYVDHSRILPSTDESGREAHIGCGAVLDHLRVAMAAAGWTANVDRFPDPNNLDHLASLHFTPMSLVTDGHRRRADAIVHRRTDRLPFAAPRNWESLKPLLRDAVDAGTVYLDVIADELRPELARASQLTESLRLYDSSYHTELYWWTGHFENSDGIPRSSLVSAAENDRVDVGRTFPVSAHNERPVGIGQDQSTVLVLSTDEDTRDDAVRCGEALSAVLLECTLAGMATCTLTHLTELQSSRHLVGTLTGRAAMPQLLIRVGEAPVLDEAPAMTPRRPLRDVLTFHPDACG